MGRIDRNEVGASLVEYAFLVALVALLCVTAVVLVGHETDATHSRNASSIINATQ
jgi:Flp pilus assembly pilin Flp